MERFISGPFDVIPFNLNAGIFWSNKDLYFTHKEVANILIGTSFEWCLIVMLLNLAALIQKPVAQYKSIKHFQII